MSADTVPLGAYLFTRLRQSGVSSVHGVPGDYNLSLLDHVSPCGLRWVGNCNELNAGYAADGYARVKGLGALVTTFGVGELSAVNAIAGAYAERAAVVHIVGCPSRQQAETGALIHHTFADGRYDLFARMHREITVAQTRLDDPATAPELVDAVIRRCRAESRPVYVELPTDMVGVPVAAGRLRDATLVDVSAPPSTLLPGATASPEQRKALDDVLDRMYAARQPMILVDGESRAYGILDELHDLILRTGFPTWTSAWGRSQVDERLPNVHGLWKGTEWGSQADKQYIAGADLVLVFGAHFSGTNTNLYTAIPDPSRSIYFKASNVQVGESSKGPAYRDLPAKAFLARLLADLDTAKLRKDTVGHEKTLEAWTDQTPSSTHAVGDKEGPITQADFYRYFGRILRPGDVILAETGTANYGVRDIVLPPAVQLFVAVTWLSIGYMLPAAQGAALAQRELHAEGKWPRLAGSSSLEAGPSSSNGAGVDGDSKPPPRTVLFIGDGSFQMTAQELGTILRERLNVLLVLINNDGYTIERCLHGYKQPYNDVGRWKYLAAPATLGGIEEKDAKQGEYHYRTASVKTWKQLEQVMREEETRPSDAGPRLSMLEVFMDKEDAPELLAKILEGTKAAEG